MTALVFFGLSYAALGIAAAFLAGLLGIGGGILIIPVLSKLFALQNMPENIIMHLALGTSLATVACNALISMRTHAKRHSLNWGIIRWMVPAMVLGSLIGPVISVRLSTPLLQSIFAVFLGMIAIQFIFFGDSKKERKRFSNYALSGASFFIGILASMLGLGGGVFMVPLLARFGLPMTETFAIAAVVLIPSSLFGALGYALRGLHESGLPAFATGYIYWPVVGLLVLLGMFFTPLGVRCAHRLPQKQLKQLFGLLLCVIALQMAHTAWQGA